MCSSNVHYYIICLTVGSLHKKQNVHEDDENKDPIDEYDCDLSSQVPHTELYHEEQIYKVLILSFQGMIVLLRSGQILWFVYLLRGAFKEKIFFTFV